MNEVSWGEQGKIYTYVYYGDCYMDDSSVDHHSGESKIAILMFTLLAGVVLLGTIGAYSYSGFLMVEEELSRGEALIWVGQEYISMVMFVTLALLLFSGYPVAFILGGLAMLFGLLGYFLDLSLIHI